MSQQPSATTPPNFTSPQPPTTATGVTLPLDRTSLELTRSSNSAPQGLGPLSCVSCRRRKTKCDKQVPCSNCTKLHTQCLFPARRRPARRPRAGDKVISDREAELLKRLKRLEGVVDELSGQVDVEQLKHSPSADSLGLRDGETTDGGGKPSTVKIESDFGRLVVDERKSAYVASPFWAKVSQEVEEIRDILIDEGLDEPDSEISVHPLKDITEPDHQSFIMGYNSTNVDLKSLHPLPSQIPFYWQTFLENVNPLVKIIHVPTMDKTIKGVQNNLDGLEKGTEALMFAIYFATVTSMTGEEVRTSLGVDKTYLLKLYRFGVEQALAQAGFLNSNEIVTLQAFVMFLVCVRRHDETRFVWSLTALAIRIAQSLGLHRDGSKFGLCPSDAEMRRRLWWQICMLDVRSSEDHGSAPSILESTFDTELPLSINDEDLCRETQELPSPRPGVSEMTFCLICYEICNLSRKLQYAPPGIGLHTRLRRELTLEDKEHLVREATQNLEERFLKHCENAGPLYWVAATVSRLIMAKMGLIIYHPFIQPGKSNGLSQDIKDRLFVSSIEIMEYSHMLETEASTKQWGWLFHTYVQWHAIAYILGELGSRSQSPIVDRAWSAVDVEFADWGVTIRNSKNGMLWLPLRKLMAKAKRKRERDARNESLLIGNNAAEVVDLDERNSGPPPTSLKSIPDGYPGTIAQDRLLGPGCSTTSVSINSPPQQTEMQRPSPPYESTNLVNGQTAQDVIIEMDMTSTLHPQQYVGTGDISNDVGLHNMQPLGGDLATEKWMVDDPALLVADADMNTDLDISWERWDEMVRDFQLECEQQTQPEGRGPALGSMGSW